MRVYAVIDTNVIVSALLAFALTFATLASFTHACGR